MRKYLRFINLLTLIITACEKSDIAENTPDCIIKEIETLKNNSICDDPSVKEYNFQGSIVYVADPGSCGADLSSGVFDSNCDEIGGLGGITGNTLINGEEFSNAIFIRVIWKK